MAAALSHIQLSNRTGVPLHVGIPQGPRSQILMMRGGGGPNDFFGSEILAKSDFFWDYERHQDFFGSQNKTRGIFWGCQKVTKGFFWVCYKKK